MNIPYERLEKILKEKGISAYKLSKMIGCSQSALSDWKHGISTPKPDKLAKIADALDISLSYLITGSVPDKLEFQAEILAKASEDDELLECLEKYYAVSNEKRQLIKNFIKMV